MGDRKESHIRLAGKSQVDLSQIDDRFEYEPMLSPHPIPSDHEFIFLQKKFKVPLWVSSMTGGTKSARNINENLARACNEFGFGMGLGSCRPLLDSNDDFDDYNLRKIIGNDRAFFANLGISQIEKLVEANKLQKVHDLVARLEADGLIIHVNPIQEWIQPEGDRLKYAPVETIKRMLDKISYQVIIKEVGQGMGSESLRELLNLPIDAIEFGAFGGTNFASLELQRRDPAEYATFEPFRNVGVEAGHMVESINRYVETSNNFLCRQIIISGGIKTFLDGYYLISKSKMNAIYGQASVFLTHAKESYDELRNFVKGQIEGLHMAMAYLQIRE